MPTVYNKVVIDGVTKIDLSQDTVTEAGHILTGHTGHLANGNQVPGTGSGGGSITITEEANTTGTTCVISIGSSPAPSETWETIWNTPITAYDDVATIPSLADYYYAENETYRVTLNSEEYRVNTYYYPTGSCYIIGNEGLLSDPSATGLPFLSYNVGWDALYVHIQNGGSGNTYPFKLEKLVTS